MAAKAADRAARAKTGVSEDAIRGLVESYLQRTSAGGSKGVLQQHGDDGVQSSSKTTKRARFVDSSNSDAGSPLPNPKRANKSGPERVELSSESSDSEGDHCDAQQKRKTSKKAKSAAMADELRVRRDSEVRGAGQENITGSSDGLSTDVYSELDEVTLNAIVQSVLTNMQNPYLETECAVEGEVSSDEGDVESSNSKTARDLFSDVTTSGEGYSGSSSSAVNDQTPDTAEFREARAYARAQKRNKPANWESTFSPKSWVRHGEGSDNEAGSNGEDDSRAPKGTDSCRRGNPCRMCPANTRVTAYACTIFSVDGTSKSLRKHQKTLEQMSAMSPTLKIASCLHDLDSSVEPHLHIFIQCDRNQTRTFVLKHLLATGIKEIQVQYLFNAWSPLGYLGYMAKKGSLQDPHSLVDRYGKLAPNKVTNEACKALVQTGKIAEALNLYPQVMRQKWMQQIIKSNFQKPHKTAIFFIWGKSGVGKSTYCKNLAKKEGWTWDQVSFSAKGGTFYLGYDKDRCVTNDMVIVDDIHCGQAPHAKDINRIYDPNSKFTLRIMYGEVLNNAKAFMMTANEPASQIWDEEYKAQLSRRCKFLRMIKHEENNYLAETDWEGNILEGKDPVDVTTFCVEDEDPAEAYDMFASITKEQLENI